MVRPNELSFARRGALSKLADRARGARPGHLVGRLVGLDSEDDHRAIVAFGDAEVSVLSGPHKLVPGALVAVEVDSTNAPTRITGPVTTRPEGLDEDVPAPDAVVPMPELGPVEFSPEDQEKLDTAVGDLSDAQTKLAWAQPLFDLLDGLGAGSNDPEVFANALAQYLEIPLDQVKVVDNRGADGQVVLELYDALIIEKFLLATEIITDTMMAKGSVTAPALNVVYVDPESGYGWRAEPEGLTFLDQEGNPAIVLRTDMANYVNIVKTIEGTGGPESFSVASISPEGDLTGRSVAANESLLYRGTELQESLDRKDSGIIAMARNTTPISIGSSEGRLLAVSFQAPSDNRMVEIKVMGRVATSERRRATIRLKQSATGVVTPLNSTQKTWYLQTDWAESFERSVTRSVGEWGWVTGDTVTVGVFVESLTAGESLSFPIPGDQEIIVKDAGPWLAIQGHAPWAPPTGGGGGGGDETAPTPRAYTKSWTATGHRTYSTTSLMSTRAASSLVQGYWAGANSRGHWIFPDSSIRTELSGASNMTGTLKIRNQGTGTGSMTAVLKVHNYASAPSSFGTTQAWTTVTVASGRDVEVEVPEWILNGFRDDTIKGVSLDHGTSTSKSFYGYFSPSASLKINYRK